MSLTCSRRWFTVACLALTCASPASFAQQYPILPVAGAPKNIKAIFQDSTGRLWVGGDQLASFDGTRFFSLRDQGLPPGSIQSMAEDASGALWIGSETGVYRFANGRVEEIAKGFAVSVIAANPDVALAAMGPVGLGVPAEITLTRMRREGVRWVTETLQSLESPGPITLDHQGVLLFPGPVTGWSELTLQDALNWRSGQPKVATRHHPGDEMIAGPRRVMRDRAGCVWNGSDGVMKYSCGGRDWIMLPYEVGPSSSEGVDGAMVLVGHNVLLAGRPGSFRAATQANGVPALNTALEAADGTIWLGGAQGLFRFASPFRMEYWTARDGVANPWAVQRLGADMYAALDRSIGRLAKDRQHWEKLEGYTAHGPVMNLMADGDNLLSAENPGGLALLSRDGKTIAHTKPQSDGIYELRLARAENKETWMGGLSLGRVIRQGTLLTGINHTLGTQPAGNVLDVQYEPNTHKLWACYNGGLAVRSEDNTWRELTTKDGLLVNACWSLAALPNGDVWYGYYTTPAFARIRPKPDGNYDVRQFRAGDGVPDPETLNFDVDHRGWLWRGGNHGLSVSDPANAEAGKWLFFDTSEGLSGEGVNSGSFFADPDGSIWIGVDLSIFHFLPPDDLLAPKFTPSVFVSAFSTGPGGLKPAGNELEFPRGSNVVAHLGSLQFDRRSALQIRYRMSGEPAWHESRSLDLPLGKLTSGAHMLEVQARLFTGPWSSSIRESLTILRPLWITWPFLLGYAACAALSVSSAFWLRSKRRADQATLLPDLGRWRLGALVPEVHDVTGTLLDGRFEAGALLARGGFANVMDGYDHVEKRRCAIKVFRNEIRDKAWVLRTFQQEVAALGKLRHPNVVSIYAHGVAPSGAPYLAMEFVEGRSLREILEEGPLSPRRTARALRQLSSALDTIHEQGICHRDVKPENIIVRNEGSGQEEMVLIDFSIAIVKDADETLYGLSRAAGTFDYMGPEQAIGYAEPSSDVYSLAKVLIEMLAGQRLKRLLPDAALDLPYRIRELAGKLPVRFSSDSIAILSTALEFDPSRRPRSAGSFAAPLAADLESESKVQGA